MQALTISLFSQLKVRYGDEQQLIEIDARRAQELFCYLLLYRDRLHEREKLAALFWPESSCSQSKRYLRQTLWQLRSALNALPHHFQLITAEHEQIGINPSAEFALDIALFEQTFNEFEKKAGRDLTAVEMSKLHDAQQVYTDNLLEGCLMDWCIYERERFQSMYLIALDKLLDYSEMHANYEAGLFYGERILHYDRARERTHRRLMRLHYFAGYRSAAIHQYDSCVASLAEELGVEPAKSTTSLYEQICSDQLTRQNEAVKNASNSAPASGHALPGSVLCELEQIQLSLSALQSRLDQIIQQINHTQSSSVQTIEQ